MDGERVIMPAAPMVVYTSRPNSHPFQERHISCQEPIKIGRSVARAHPAPTNAIFDCKVLSRNHALLWFEDNKFYLQDTKSSNGTFVNNQRLSRGSEESEPHEVFSGDIIQFGVDVMENSKRVTHGCIMASITLYLPDGTEAKPRLYQDDLLPPDGAIALIVLCRTCMKPETIQNTLWEGADNSERKGSQTNAYPSSSAHSQEMYQLSQYLKEALHREQVLQDKMSHIQRLMHQNSETCETSWHALINEDRLLSKLEVLQNQLSVFSKNQTEGSLTQQIITMEEERLNYEMSSKQSLRKVLEEKIKAIQELTDLQRSLANTEDECKHLKELHEEHQQELLELTEKYETKVMEHADLSHKLQEAERKREDELASFEQEKQSIQVKLEQSVADRDSLLTELSSLQEQNEKRNNNTNKSDEEKRNGDESDSEKINGQHSDDEQDNKLSHESQQELIDSLQSKLDDSQTQIEALRAQRTESEKTLEARDDEIKSLNHQIDQANLEIVQYVTKVATLEEKTKSTDTISTEDAIQDLQEKLKQTQEADAIVIKQLQEEVEQLKSADKTLDETITVSSEVKDLQGKLDTAQCETDEVKNQLQHIQDQLQAEQKLHDQSRDEASELKDELDQARTEIEEQAKSTTNFKEKTKDLEDKLEAMSSQHMEQVTKAEEDNSKLKQEAANNKKECESLKQECSSLRSRIQAIEDELQRLQQDNSKLDTEVDKTKTNNKELAEEINKLQKSYTELKLLKETLESREITIQDNLTDTQKEAKLLKEQLESERSEREALLSKYNQSVEELERSKQEVETTQALHSESQNKLETLKQELETVTQQYTEIANKSKSMSLSSTIPLMVLMLAVVLALFPFLSRVTSGSTPAEPPL